MECPECGADIDEELSDDGVHICEECGYEFEQEELH